MSDVKIKVKSIKGRKLYVVGDSVASPSREHAKALLEDTGVIHCPLTKTLVESSATYTPSAPVVDYRKGGHGLLKN